MATKTAEAIKAAEQRQQDEADRKSLVRRVEGIESTQAEINRKLDLLLSAQLGNGAPGENPQVDADGKTGDEGKADGKADAKPTGKPEKK